MLRYRELVGSFTGCFWVDIDMVGIHYSVFEREKSY